MSQLKIHIKRVCPEKDSDIPLPSYMTAGSAGMDIFAAVNDSVILSPGERTAIPTGITIAIPPGYEAQIRPRSGLAIKHGITLINAPGTIDSDYRGEIRILLINHGPDPVKISRGDRIAQMIISSAVRAKWEEVQELPDTDRGAGGFGHTG